MKVPSADVHVDADLVARLLAAQHPDLCALPLCAFAEGWDNTIWRLGEHLLVRLPRRELASELVVHEQRWLPGLAARLPLPVPAPVRVGTPSLGYPWHWSIVPFLEGRPASLSPPLRAKEAGTLGAFLAALHRPAPPEAPTNHSRAVPLRERDATLKERVEELCDARLAGLVRAAWSEVLDLASFDGPRQWIHGDLHPGNVLVSDGAISGVIDFGDLCAGDPATDLAGAWMLFDDEACVRRVLEAAGADEPTSSRARGWAVFFGVLLATLEHDALGLRGVGLATLRRLLDR